MTKQCFTAVIRIRGINPYILVSAARAKSIRAPWRSPLPVLVRINDQPAQPWRINMMPVGDGNFYLYLHEAVRKASGTKVGDRVQVQISFDAKYKKGPAHPVPSWFKEALRENEAAKKSWKALIPSRRKGILRYFARLKSADARTRNLEQALHVLSGHKGRFMARSWQGGR